MKKRICLSTFVCLLVLFGCKEGQKQKHTIGEITMVSPEEAQELIALEDTQLVDVRTVEEFENGQIKGALNLVYQKNFKKKIQNLDKTKPIVVYCQTGNRSAKCAEILKKAGFKKIYDLEGGLSQWKRKGNPIVK